MLRASVGLEPEQPLLNEILQIACGSRANFKALHCTTEALIRYLSKECSEEILLLVLPTLHKFPNVVLNRLKGSKAFFQADGPFRLLDQTGQPLITPLARARLVSLLRVCVDGAAQLRYPRAVKKQMEGLIPKWVVVFKELLLDDPNKDVQEKCWDALYLKQAIFEVSKQVYANCTLAHIPV